MSTLTLLPDLPELGTLDRHKIAALVGVASTNRDSGTYLGKRIVWDGRSRMRQILFMATLRGHSTQANFQPFCDRLLAAGKPKKEAITACMRKLLAVINDVVRHDQFWHASYAHPA